MRALGDIWQEMAARRAVVRLGAARRVVVSRVSGLVEVRHQERVVWRCKVADRRKVRMGLDRGEALVRELARSADPEALEEEIAETVRRWRREGNVTAADTAAQADRGPLAR